MPRMSGADKRERIVEVLLDHRHRMLGEVVNETGLTVGQFRSGWQLVKAAHGAMAVCERHRERSVYYLTDDSSVTGQRQIKMMVLQQSRDIHTRLRTELGTLLQQQEFNERHELPAGSVYAAIMNIRATKSAVANDVRANGYDLGFASETIERWLADLPGSNLEGIK